MQSFDLTFYFLFVLTTVEDTSASVSTVTNNFQTLSLPEEDTPSEEDGPAVKIPDHLQVQSAECSHLSFGSFGTGVNAPFSGSFGSRAMASNEEESALSADDPSTVHSEARYVTFRNLIFHLLCHNDVSFIFACCLHRNPEYYEDEHLRTASDVHTSHRMGGSSGNFDAPSASQQDMLKQEAPEIAQANQYSFPSSTANYGFDNSQQLNSYANLQTSSQMQGMPSLSGVMVRIIQSMCFFPLFSL